MCQIPSSSQALSLLVMLKVNIFENYIPYPMMINLGVHAQQGLLYSVCVYGYISVCVVCLSVTDHGRRNRSTTDLLLSYG